MLAAELHAAFKSAGSMAFTTDMWTDNHRQRSYSCVTGHWINTDWELRSRVLATQEFSSTLAKTGINVKQHLTEIFQHYEINTDLLTKAVFTTDKGSNIVCALRDEERLDCVNHVLNRVLQHALEAKHAPQAITDLITASKSLVHYVKINSLQDLLTKTLKQSCATRWNSTFYMLQSVLDAHDDLKKLFANHKPKELHRVTSISATLLSALVDLLTPFESATKACEGQKEPTLHLVIPKIKKLKLHCEVSI